MTALLLLAASAQAGLGSALLLPLILGLLVVGSSRRQRRTPCRGSSTKEQPTCQADPGGTPGHGYPPEQVIAVLYLRSGRLRLRRRTAA